VAPPGDQVYVKLPHPLTNDEAESVDEPGAQKIEGFAVILKFKVVFSLNKFYFKECAFKLVIKLGSKVAIVISILFASLEPLLSDNHISRPPGLEI
jgi:hypothetical protein